MLAKQTTDTVVMVSPDCFQFNAETANTNAFQTVINSVDAQTLALHEFKQMVNTLIQHQIQVITLPSPIDKLTPDAVFPNNWFSTHEENGTVKLILYPMLNINRRNERQINTLKNALQQNKITISKEIDFTYYEKSNLSLEGTGSLVLDRRHRLAFASLSPRTHQIILDEFAKKLDYKIIAFHSYDNNTPIYHTNVMLSIGTHFAVIALESITDLKERSTVLNTLHQCGKDIIEISTHQMKKMTANILEVKSILGDSKIILSQTAFNALTQTQIKKLQQYGDLIIVNIDTIEKIGGGSARCMIAEIFY